MLKRWQYQNHPNADEILTRQSNSVLRSVFNSPPREFIEHIKDTRCIHKMLFEQLVDDDQKHFVGHYRGEDYTDLINRNGARKIEIFPGLYVIHRFTESKDVKTKLENLEHCINYLYVNRNEIEKQHYYCLAVKVLIHFYLIHPYVNGNGHIGRVIITFLMRIANIEIDESWSIHPRPYTNAIAVCMFAHNKYPIVAEQYFRQWFHLPNDNINNANHYADSSYSCVLSYDDSDSDSNESSAGDSDSDSCNSPCDDSDSDSDQPSKGDSVPNSYAFSYDGDTKSIYQFVIRENLK